MKRLPTRYPNGDSGVRIFDGKMISTRMVCTPSVLRTWLVALALVAVGPSSATAQDIGRIVGRVVEAGTARPLSAVQVFTADQSVGTLSDVDGRFLLLNVPAGPVDIQAQIIGYATKTITGVQVTRGQVTQLDITLESSAVALEGITVSAEREEGSAAFLLDQRRTSRSLLDAVGAAEIAASPASDAADVATRITGVTVSEGKYVYVRGLGDRYSQTSLNGAPLPSPEPEKETVPLDLFPSGFLESLTTQKSYTADRPADFAGGTVEIQTKEFPEAFSFTVGLGTSFNDRSAGKSTFLTYDGGGLDWLGRDDGTRAIPNAVDQYLGGIRGERLPSDPEVVRQLGLAMPRHFSPYQISTPVNRGFDIGVGGSTAVADRLLGYFIAVNYGDSYTIRDREQERKWRVTAFDPGAAPDASPNVDYSFTRGTRTVQWGALGNLAFNLAPRHQLGLRVNLTRSTDDEARTFTGFNNEDIGGDVQASRLRYQNRDLYWGQLSGEHGLFLDSRLSWKATGARAFRDEPGLREALYTEETDGVAYLDRIGVSGRMFYSELTDDDLSATVDWEFPFDFVGNTAALKFGGMVRARERDFASRRFQWNFLSGITTEIEAPLAIDDKIVGQRPRKDEMQLREIVEPGGVYGATDDRYGGYGMVTLPAGDWEFILGARVETYALQVTGADTTYTDINQTDFAPSLNVLWRVRDDLNLRAALSQTVDRPEFRELSPFQFTEATSLRQLLGNPSLTSATLQSADLRVDWFFSPWELFAAGVFHKRITDPVEQVFIAAASTAYSYQNAEKADIAGVELEGQLRLGRFGSILDPFSVNANFSWIHSEVTVRETSIFLPTNLERPLEGQSPYVLNLGLNWGIQSGWEAGVFYNRLGERLTAAGGFGLPDIYLQPRNSLDASLRIPLSSDAYVRVRATNILDEEYLYTQAGGGITRMQQVYNTGRVLSLKLGWQVF
jgi:outer membrane receptor protein involved in Fe transport